MREQDGNVEDRYRHVRHHPVFGGGSASEAAAPGRTARRPGAGPRRVRPGVVPVPSRPAQPRRPSASAVPAPTRPVPAGVVGGHTGPRVLVRRLRPVAPGRARFLVRRWVAGAVLVVVVALVVVALGLLADAVSAARHPVTPAPATAVVTVEVPGTVWDVAGRIEPGASPAERAALVGRIVTANSLTTGEVRPGQVLAVPSR